MKNTNAMELSSFYFKEYLYWVERVEKKTETKKQNLNQDQFSKMVPNFSKKDPIGVFLCGESIARILKA